MAPNLVAAEDFLDLIFFCFGGSVGGWLDGTDDDDAVPRVTAGVGVGVGVEEGVGVGSVCCLEAASSLLAAANSFCMASKASFALRS